PTPRPAVRVEVDRVRRAAGDPLTPLAERAGEEPAVARGPAAAEPVRRGSQLLAHGVELARGAPDERHPEPEASREDEVRRERDVTTCLGGEANVVPRGREEEARLLEAHGEVGALPRPPRVVAEIELDLLLEEDEVIGRGLER